MADARRVVRVASIHMCVCVSHVCLGTVPLGRRKEMERRIAAMQYAAATIRILVIGTIKVVHMCLPSLIIEQTT